MWQLIASLLLITGVAILLLSVLDDFAKRSTRTVAANVFSPAPDSTSSDSGDATRGRIIVTIFAMRVSAIILIIEGAISILLGALGSDVSWWPKNVTNASQAVQWALATSGAATIGTLLSVIGTLRHPASSDRATIQRYVDRVHDRSWTALIPIFLGTLSGLFVYALVASDLIMGRITGLNDGVPTTVKDASFLLLLGAAAGFVEELIPNLLRKVAENAENAVHHKDNNPTP